MPHLRRGHKEHTYAHWKLAFLKLSQRINSTFFACRQIHTSRFRCVLLHFGSPTCLFFCSNLKCKRVCSLYVWIKRKQTSFCHLSQLLIICIRFHITVSYIISFYLRIGVIYVRLLSKMQSCNFKLLPLKRTDCRIANTTGKCKCVCYCTD